SRSVERSIQLINLIAYVGLCSWITAVLSLYPIKRCWFVRAPVVTAWPGLHSIETVRDVVCERQIRDVTNGFAIRSYNGHLLRKPVVRHEIRKRTVNNFPEDHRTVR